MSSDNTAFTTRAYSSDEAPSFRTGMDEVTLSFGKSLPYAIIYTDHDRYDAFYKIADTLTKELETTLRELGKSDADIIAISKSFFKDATQKRRDIYKTPSEAEKLIKDIERLTEAFANVSKSKLIEYIHILDQQTEEAATELAKLVKEYTSEHAK